MTKIKCDNITYRKGFVEVSGDIHKGCINLEAWNIHPDTELSQDDSAFNSIPDEAFTGNVELELNIENAKELVKRLEELIAIADNARR